MQADVADRLGAPDESGTVLKLTGCLPSTPVHCRRGRRPSVTGAWISRSDDGLTLRLRAR